MADRLKNIIRFTGVAPGGASTVLPHGLRWGTRARTPDTIKASVLSGLTITADDTNITVVNNGNAAVDVDVLVEAWHTVERSFGPESTQDLTPQPFIEAARVSNVDGMVRGPGTSQRLVYVRTGGSDTTGDGLTAATAYATIDRALQDLPLVIYGSSWVIDITGMTIARTIPIVLPPSVSTDKIEYFAGDLMFPWMPLKTPITIQAEPTTIDTIEAADIVSNVAAPTTGLRTLTVNRAYGVDEHRRRFLVGSGLSQIAPIASNTANVLSLCTTLAFTAPLRIIDLSASINMGAVSNSAILTQGLGAGLLLRGIDVTHGLTNYGSISVGSTPRFEAHTCRMDGVYVQEGVGTCLFYGCVFRGFPGVGQARHPVQFSGSGPSFYNCFFDQTIWRNYATVNQLYIVACIFDGCSSIGHGNNHEVHSTFQIDNSWIKNGTDDGVAYWGGARSSCRSVQIDGSVGNGVYAHAPGQIYLEKTIGTGNATYGVYATDGSHVQVDGNTVVTGVGGDLKSGAVAVRTWADFRANPPLRNAIDGDSFSRIWQ